MGLVGERSQARDPSSPISLVLPAGTLTVCFPLQGVFFPSALFQLSFLPFRAYCKGQPVSATRFKFAHRAGGRRTGEGSAAAPAFARGGLLLFFFFFWFFLLLLLRQCPLSPGGMLTSASPLLSAQPSGLSCPVPGSTYLTRSILRPWHFSQERRLAGPAPCPFAVRTSGPCLACQPLPPLAGTQRCFISVLILLRFCDSHCWVRSYGKVTGE